MSIIFRILNIAIIVAAVTLPVGAVTRGRGTGMAAQEALNGLQKLRSQPMTQEEREEKRKEFEENLGSQNFVQRDNTTVYTGADTRGSGTGRAAQVAEQHLNQLQERRSQPMTQEEREEKRKEFEENLGSQNFVQRDNTATYDVSMVQKKMDELEKKQLEKIDAIDPNNLDTILAAYGDYDACNIGHNLADKLERQLPKTECVRLFQSGVKVHMGSGVGLAKIYVSKNKSNEEIQCMPSFYTRGPIGNTDDYLTCVSAKTIYTFAFDSLNQSSDRIIKQSITHGLVKMTGGGSCDFQGSFSRCGGYSTKNTQLENYLKLFGYAGKFINDLNSQPYYEIYYLAFSDEGQLRTIDGVDNMRFRYFQTKFMADLEVYLKNYVERALVAQGRELKTFNCNYGSRTLYIGKYTTIPRDDVLTCWANNNPIDFVFDDLSEPRKTISEGGTAGLECITLHGGNYQNGYCHGFTEEQCLTEIAPNVAGGARWDDNLNACVLNSAKTAENIQRYSQAAVKVGLATGIALLSGGGGVVLAVAAWSGTVGTVLAEGANLQADYKITSIMATSNQCQCGDCTTNALRTFMMDIEQYPVDDLRENDAVAISYEYNRLITCLINEKGQAVADELMKQQDIMREEQDLSNFVNWPAERKLGFVGNGIQALSAVVGVGYGALKSIPKLLNNMKSVPKAMNSLVNLGQKLTHSIPTVKKTIDGAAEIYGSYDDFNDMIGFVGMLTP